MNAFRFLAVCLVLASMASADDKKFAYPSGMFAELPHERAELIKGFKGVNFPLTTKDEMARKFFQQAAAHSVLGTKFEAAQSYREVITRDPDCAMGYFGIAQSMNHDLSLATEYVWYAYQRRDNTNAREREIIESAAKVYGVETEPEMVLVDRETGKRRAKPTLQSQKERIERRRRFVVPSKQPKEGPITKPALLRPTKFLDALRYRHFAQTWGHGDNELAGDTVTADSLLRREAACRLMHGWLTKRDAMPYEYPDYFRRRQAGLSVAVDSDTLNKEIAAFPRHPGRPYKNKPWTGPDVPLNDSYRSKVTASASQVRIIESLGPLRWTPPKAPAFILPRGKEDGTLGIADLNGKPTLVVFYLGFGCIHCVEQLNELRPRHKDFKDAGIEIVAIGTDPVDKVRAAILDSIEVDGPKTPFEILCDPKGDTFKAFHCWDEFTDEPLHGTFLIDGKGRIRWRDISTEPFMQTDFLLKECNRLIAE